jgi:hypothetical protein
MRLALPLVALALVWGCAPDDSRYPAPSQCDLTACKAVSPGGQVTGTGGSGSGGSDTGGAATADQSGIVYRVVSPFFDDPPASAYAGAATIQAISDATHTTASTSYGGAVGATFGFTSIPAGPTWFLVQDSSAGASGVLSTFSYADVPVLPSLALPVIDQGTLENIAFSLPSLAATGVSTQLAHVILFVNRNGARYQGASVSGGTGNAQVAYDAGAGYSDSATVTGPQGIAILFNASLSGESSILITDTVTTNTYTVAIQAGLGAATLAEVELP